MHKQIKKAAVLGSGVMGSGIAAHLANIGIPVLLLDIVPNELTKDDMKKGRTVDSPEVRSRLSQTAVKKLLKQKPAPLTSAKNISYITPGNLEDDAEKLNEADWIIEVVVENLEVKNKFSLWLMNIANPAVLFPVIHPGFQCRTWLKADQMILRRIS